MTNLGRIILAWLFRHLLALVLILVILIVLPPAVRWVSGQIEASRTVSAQRSAYAGAAQRFDRWSEERQAEAEAATARLAQMPEAELRERRAGIDPAVAEARRARLSGGQIALAAASGDTDRLFAHYRAGAEIALLERERRYIDALLATRFSQGRQANLQQRRQQALVQLRSSHARWRDANARAEALNRRPMAEARNFVCRNAAPIAGCDNYRALQAAIAERDAALAVNRRARREIEAIDRTVRALGTARAAAEDVSAAFEAQRQALAPRLAELERQAGENWLLWIRKPVLETLPTALLILATVIFAPMLIKAFLYFVFAPLAARRPPIRLVPGEKGMLASEGTPPSAVSQRVQISPGEELLVVPEAVQSTPHEAAKATQWLLSWSMPLSSIASGMVALVRVRPPRPDFVLVSATRDALSEVAIIAVGSGSAVVLRPRALRGIIQPMGQPVRITRHWRLGHLAAWLTLQFRYLVFHGPCKLIVQGTRGVRLEPAGPGRGVNQAATIGFSAGLAYSVRRSEAFGAYLIGKQELFNDSFESAEGWSLYEEMPREGERGGLWGRGLRGLGDAFLKVFGI